MFDTYVSTIDRVITEQYENLLENALKPYGIDKSNIIKNAHRVAVVCHHSVCDFFQTSNDYYIDGTYAFSIQKILTAENNRMSIDIKIAEKEKYHA